MKAQYNLHHSNLQYKQICVKSIEITTFNMLKYFLSDIKQKFSGIPSILLTYSLIFIVDRKVKYEKNQ